MSNKTKRLLVAVSIMVTAAIGLNKETHALKPPHDSSGLITQCNQCHSRTGAGFRTVSSFNNLCFNAVGCHNSSGGPNNLTAKKKILTTKDASNRFGSIAQSPATANTIMPRAVATQHSHGWKIPNTNTLAGATVQAPIPGTNAENIRAQGKVYCTRCHRVMGTTGGAAVHRKFLRWDPQGNYICYQCHSARRIDNVRAPLESSALHYSHPVEVNYSTAHGKKPDFFETSPQLTAGYDESARPGLYTTHNTAAVPYQGSSRLAGTNKGAVVCQSCHGPLHSADSNPYTFDNLSAWSSGVVNYSTSAGNLLRAYPIAGSKASDNLCKSCHKVKVHETNYPGLPANYFSCGRCHTPHKKAGEANRYLILENISTPFNGIRPVYFVSTSAMAKRYGAGTENEFTPKQNLGGYSTTLARLNKDRTVSAAICQVCHTRTKYQRNYSSTTATRRGGTGTGHDQVYNDGSGKFRFCPDCHMHTSAFKPAGAAACGSCHVAPPYDTYSGGASTRVIGRHAKHVKRSNGDSTGASYSWDGGTLVDDRSQDAYGFSCGRCHSPYANYSDSQHKPSNFDDNVFSIRTADVGFVRAAANEALPKNTGATYTYQARGVGDWGANNLGSKWSTPDAGGNGRCNNLYCHGQWYNGYTSNNPTFTGTQPCGSCHGAKRSDPPGKTNGVNYGAHPRHVGNANNQQYNSSGWKFGCSACHQPTVMSSITSIDDRSSHVNGRVNVDFNGGGYGNANSTYGGFAGFTSREPAMGTRPGYKTCGLIYCHSDGSRTQGNYSVPFNAEQGSGTTKFPNWSSSSRGNFTTTQTINGKSFKRRCSRCHGNATYKGITAAMPGYATRAGKGNSHDTHIKNGFLCNVCHGTTVNADNKSIASTTNHVNAFYNISIISSYKTGQTGYSSTVSAKKTCKNVRCHAGKTTPLWGTSARCQDCHLSNTGDTDKRILARSKFTAFTSAAPKIYSTQWANVGHGKATGNYTSSRSGPDRNPGANRVCTECHRASVSHGTAANPFRLLTAPDRPNMVCERCHGVGASEPGVIRTEIQTHASSITATGRHNFAIKCIDCHDPHGDNNRFMLHSTLPTPSNPERRSVGSGRYGIITGISIKRNVDFVNDAYTSDYARKFQADKVCQDCHRRTIDPSDSSKKRFRYYSSGDTAHGGAKCVNCHTHASGFKGAGCNYCHGAPPTGLQNILSGAGRINPTKKRASSSTTAGAHFRHYTIFTYLQGNSVSVTCSKCHQGGMYNSGSENVDIDLGFKAFTDYSGSSQKYYGQQAVSGGYYGYAGIGAGPAPGFGSVSSLRCDVKCHGAKGKWLTASYGTPTAPKWDVPNTARCGKCHGVKKAQGSGSWPTSNRHEKHVGTGTAQYDFMCRLCHADTVMGMATTLNRTNHVNGEATFKFYTGTFTGNRVWSGSTYSGDTNVNSGFGRCENLYCHSRGTKTLQSYTGIAFPNYTAKWDLDISAWNDGEKCSLCHGSKAYKGITSAMPNQSNQAHKKHVVDNGFKCNFCHSATVNSNNAIISVTNHVNKFKNISVISSYRTGQTMYSSSLSSTNKTCKNIRCHAGRKTPNWTSSYDSIKCTDCHYQSSGAAASEDNFAWTNFSGTAAKIYSTEWADRGHGRARANKYAFSNNSGAAKTCTNCHKSAVKHGDGNNYFRLMTSNPDRLCLACHGLGAERIPAIGFSRVTGIQSHTWKNISTNGYNGGAIKAASRGGWNFGQHEGSDSKKVKCVDCHDPHGDKKNNYMIHSYINMSGSDQKGRPNPNAAVALMTFTAVGGPQINWSSYVKPLGGELGICQRCHSNMMSGTTSIMANFNKNLFSNHNRGKRCTDCHKHRKGFAPAGCDSCHDYPPPKAPTTLGWNTYADEMSNRSSLHVPHAWNVRQRPGIPTIENNVDSAGGKGADERGYFCYRCHDGDIGGNGQSPTHGQGYPGKANASMKNLTMLNGDWSKGALDGYQSVADDTCSNIKCHTPRAYTRQWKKPTDCDDCHGYRNKNNLSFNVQTTNAHKIHVSYTTAGYDKKKYGLACSNCHYDWQTINNYSTHYSSYVNITANGPINTIANMKIKEGLFYTKGRLFDGYTTGNESFGTCAKAYCHGNFTNGTTGTLPNWKKGVSPVTCLSCHKGRLTFNNGSTMPERHQKHVKTNQYGFACVRCHVRTTNNITTIIFNYSSHVNGRKDVYFNNQGGIDNTVGSFNPVVTSRQCSNTYCHSKGYRSAGSSFTTRTTLANYTADWDVTASGRTSGKPCSFCHGNKTYNGITAAMPNQTSLWGNSHRTHVIRNNFRCVNCHSATVNSAGAINYAGGRHVDGFKTITIIGAYKSGATNYGAGKTCDNVKCHAGKTTPKWGTYATCKNCHFVATGGDTDNYADFRNFSGTAAKIYSTEWASKGHGSVGQNIQCTNCHKATAPHDGKDGSGNMRNPYRLLTSQSVALCGNCHGTSSERSQWNSNGEYIASVYQDIKPHTRADTNGDAAWNTHSTAQGRSVKCIDCHDPHGDKNRKMVHALINMSGSDRFGRPKGRPWADGADSTVTAQMTFTSHGASGGQIIWSSFANGNVARSICRRCHTPKSQDPNMGNAPGAPDFNYGEMTKFKYATSHQSSHGSKCTSCHQHTKGFKGAKCDACHGYPPTGMFNLISGNNTRSNENRTPRSSSSATPGAHGRHSSVLLQGQAGGALSTLCNFCHSGGMSTTGSEDSNITIRFGTAGTFAQYTAGLYKGQNAVRDGFYDYSGYPGMKSTTGTMRCETVKCHGAQGTWLTASYGPVTAPKWDDKNTAKCGKCHGAKKAPGQGSWPTTKAHIIHAGTGSRQQNLMCRTCHGITVLGTATTLSKANHVNAKVFVELTSAGGEARVGGDSAYTGNDTVNAGFGQCDNVYCHSTGTDRVAPYGELPNFAATWTTIRGTYKKANGQLAKCNFCHGNSMSGVTSAMPNYTNDSPKANKHPKHVLEYNFLCNSCHNRVVSNNTSIRGDNYGLHVNRAYNVNFTSVVRSGNSINNSQGRYTSTNSGCRATYCHSRGSDFSSYVIPNYTAHWSDNRGGYKQPKANMAKCNYCHGSRNTYSGMTSAMPNYVNLSPKANRHPMHVVNYGFACTVCHTRVTANNTSIDAAGGRDRHVNKTYNIDFSKTAPFADNTGTYVYSATSPGSKCKNTYCHSRGTDLVKPYNTRTSFSNWTARWGDTRNSYKQANGLKAKCNYCHGNRLFSGMTSAMPNYTSATTNTAKWNTHPIHVRRYGFACTICHVKVTSNNSSIDAAGGTALHVNNAYNVNFKANVRGDLTNNTGVYVGSGTDLTVKNKCKNTYCHSRGTDFTKPYNTRTSFANWTARWGDSRGGYRPVTIGQKAKCNYCHGNRLFGGITAAMPNYSGTTTTGVTAKRNSHRKHVIDNGFVCSTCHNNIVRNNTSISDPSRHIDRFYNISFAPAYRSGAGTYSYAADGGTCSNATSCHGGSSPKWGDPSTANCKMCHFSYRDKDNYARSDGTKTEIYSTEWRRKGHGQFDQFTSKALNRCERCHKPDTGHNVGTNPFRLRTSVPDKLCAGCHGSSTERNAASWGVGINATNVDYITHSKAATGGDASWNTHSSISGKGPKCIDCHDPHGDKNRKMIHSYLNHSGSDKFGRPKGRPWTEDGQIGYSTAAMMTFTTWGNAQPIWSSFANNNVNRSICRRCHTPKGNDDKMGNNPSPNFGEMTKGNYAVDHQTHGATCTASCHKHTSGFKGAGESTGGQQCKGCHAPLFNAMTSKINSDMPAYHHVLANTDATYSNVTLFSGGAARDSARRCLMCHVDHNRFRSDAPYLKTRSKNLRPTARTAGNYTTGINTDFWPAKRAGKYLGTKPVDGPAGLFGVCASCHNRAQSKNTTFQTNNQGQYATPVFGTTNFIATYTSSSHNFQIISGMNKFFTDGSRFRANCSKCHGSPEYAIQNPQGKGQWTTVRYQRFGLHDTKYQSLNRPMGNITAMPNPLSKQLCFRCHSTAVRGSYDYYSSVQMDTGAKLIQTAIEAKPTSNHPVGQYAGHKPDEYSRAAIGWNNYIDGSGNDVKHIECTDCHNTHGGNASIVRSVGSPNGNRIGGAQAGVWGVSTSGLTGPGVEPTYTKKQQVTYQWQMCAKCHTKFAWGTNHSIKAPSQGYGSFPNYSVYLTDVVKEFNPKNNGYHPVMAPGKNQPGKGANTSWPNSGNGVQIRWYDAYNNVSGLANVSGLDYAFIPPFNRRSTIGCTDCHQADSTGEAIASYAPNNVISAGSWTNASVGSLSDTDSVTANSTDATVLNMDVYNPTSYASATKVELVVYAKHNGGSAQSITWDVKKAGTSVQTSTFSVAKGSAITKNTVDITINMGGANGCNGTITPTCLNTGVTIELSESSASVFNVDAAYINATFAMTDALRGPHGSLMQWILASANDRLYVDWNDDLDLYADAGERVNDPTYIVADYEKRTFCWNCHRFRTYQVDATNGDYSAAEGNYSRFKHWQVVNVNGAHTLANFAGNKWGIPCMFCHGGGDTGAIHGDWQGTTWGGATLTDGRPASARLLNGAGAHYMTTVSGVSAGILRCYIGATSGVGNGKGLINSCSASGQPEGSQGSTVFNYTYTAYQ